jgi:hypothetical protein
MSRRAVFALATLLAVALGFVLGAAAFNLRRAGRVSVDEEKAEEKAEKKAEKTLDGKADPSSVPSPPPQARASGTAAPAPIAPLGGATRRPAQDPTRLDAGVAPAAAPTEAALMERLRGLDGSDPPLTFQLAREGNARFPDSPDAAERSWMVAKSLVDMHRLHEAYEEAQSMVNRYPGTSWAQDLQRHLLSNPLD